MRDTSRASPQPLGPFSEVGREGMPAPAQRPRGSKLTFTPDDDHLLVDLKEKKNLSWRQIADFFPGRSSGTLQVRYCTKLKAKTTVWTDDMVCVTPWAHSACVLTLTLILLLEVAEMLTILGNQVQKLQQAMQEYENDRWRIISSKVGSGFSPTACRDKAAEIEAQEDEEKGQSGYTPNQHSTIKTVNLKQDQESVYSISSAGSASVYSGAELKVIPASSGISGYKSRSHHKLPAKLSHHFLFPSYLDEIIPFRDTATQLQDYAQSQRYLEQEETKQIEIQQVWNEWEEKGPKYLEEAQREDRGSERKGKAEETAAMRRSIENSKYQIPMSGEARAMNASASLRTYPAEEPLLLSKQSQKLFIHPPPL